MSVCPVERILKLTHDGPAEPAGGQAASTAGRKGVDGDGGGSGDGPVVAEEHEEDDDGEKQQRSDHELEATVHGRRRTELNWIGPEFERKLEF